MHALRSMHFMHRRICQNAACQTWFLDWTIVTVTLRIDLGAFDLGAVLFAFQKATLRSGCILYDWPFERILKGELQAADSRQLYLQCAHTVSWLPSIGISWLMHPWEAQGVVRLWRFLIIIFPLFWSSMCLTGFWPLIAWLQMNFLYIIWEWSRLHIFSTRDSV